MRSVPSEISSKLDLKKQTKANSADPSASIWIGRPTTALITDTFLEKQTVLEESITDTSIAVCHPRLGAANTKINVAYVQDGVAKVITASTKTKMDNHIWVDSGFSESASAVAIAYDGTMPKNDRGIIEFVTESQPWIFWIDGGELYAKRLDESSATQLASANATDVSAIRASWSSIGDFDFGLIVFYILSGDIYYRQLIGGVWGDAALIGFGPAVTYVSIAATRTWDYRICLQAKDSTDVVYELYTQYMGVGKQNVEHIDFVKAEAAGEATPVIYTDTETTEHIDWTSADADGDVLYMISGVPRSCQNLNDGTGNWGILIVATFTYRLMSISSGFYIQDANGYTYAASASLVEEDGRRITFSVADFNLAEGQVCTFRYTPGTTMSEGVALESFAFEFSPINLVAPQVDPPEMEDVWNE